MSEVIINSWDMGWQKNLILMSRICAIELQMDFYKYILSCTKVLESSIDLENYYIRMTL